MRKLLSLICIVALAVLLLSALNGKLARPGEDAPRVTSVSEAAFSMRSTGAADATSRLVGNFVSERGDKYCFSGSGEVKRVTQNLSSVIGRYSLLQSADGAAILDMELDGGKTLYSFALASPEGSFTLTDGNGTAQIFNPVPY